MKVQSVYAALSERGPVITDAHRLAQFEEHMVAAMAALTRAKCCIGLSEGSSAVDVANSAAWSARDVVRSTFRQVRR